MAEISNEEYKQLLKDHDRWCAYSWQDEICKQALADREKLEKIEEVLASMEYTDDEVLESFAFRQIEQILKEVE